MTYPNHLVAEVARLTREGYGRIRIGKLLGLHPSMVKRIRESAGVTGNDALDALQSRYEAGPVEGVQRDKEEGKRREVDVVLRGTVTTPDEAIAAANVDLDVWEPAGMETRHYLMPAEGGPVQATYIKLRFTKRTGPDTERQIGAIVDGVLKAREHAAPKRRATFSRTGVDALGLVVLTDPHFGKLVWSETTGGNGNWDLKVAQRTVLSAFQFLLDRMPPCERLLVACLGDVYHYDTLGGTTTGGTVMDRDSRIAQVLEVGAETVTAGIAMAAARAPTEVVLVPGNHDAVQTLALQRILVAEFRRDDRVTVDPSFGRRKPYAWGKTLLQFDHGDKAKKKLAHMLPQEHPVLWGASTYREIHTGHLHNEKEELYASADTEQGVIVRTHEALCPQDGWHFDEGFTGSPRSMKAFVYHKGGALEAMVRFDPRVHMEAP
jgi:hypothetical protein